MNKLDANRLEELLEWLADEVAVRLHSRTAAPPAAERPRPTPAAPPALAPATGFAAASPPPALAPAAPVESPPEPAAPAEEALPKEPSHAAQLLGRLAIGLLLAVILINLPFGRHGAALARMIPTSATLVIRNGLLVREAGTPDVYVYEDGKFRWITDLEAFRWYGYRWENVHEVTPGFLADYPAGSPVARLVKCAGSPHVYRLEGEAKRWIVDIATFEAEGYQWSDVQIVNCSMLTAMPMGETIPPGHGPAPEP